MVRKKGTIALGKEFPLIDLWLLTNRAIIAGRGEKELGILSDEIKAFLTDTEKGKLEVELYDLQLEIEKRRLTRNHPIKPKEWKNDKMRILLKHADNASLFDTELIGDI